MSEKKEESPASAKAEGAAPAAGGIKAMLPLIIAVVMMPVLAYAMTSFVLLPKLKAAASAGASAEGEAAHGEEPAADAHGGGGHGEAKESGGHGAAEAKGGHGEAKGESAKGGKQSVQLSKMIVNVAGSMGTRYLMTSLTLVSSQKNFKQLFEDNKDQLLDLATGALQAKTIADLEKPGSRNQIRSELLTIFNNALGSSTVQEIYITEMAIQ